MKNRFVRYTITSLLLVGTTLCLSAEEPRLENSKQRATVTGLHGKPAPKLALTQWLNTEGGKAPDTKGKIRCARFLGDMVRSMYCLHPQD